MLIAEIVAYLAQIEVCLDQMVHCIEMVHWIQMDHLIEQLIEMQHLIEHLIEMQHLIEHLIDLRYECHGLENVLAILSENASSLNHVPLMCDQTFVAMSFAFFYDYPCPCRSWCFLMKLY